MWMPHDQRQCLGGNPEAQNILRTEITSAIPTLDAEYGICDAVINKFYDWLFPFRWTEDGGANRYWKISIDSLIFRNAKLEELETFFVGSGTGSTFEESYSGSDTEEFEDTRETTERHSGGISETRSGRGTKGTTDNRETVTEVEFSAIPTSSTELTASKTSVGLPSGKNTTEEESTTSDTLEQTDDRQVTRGFSAGKNSTTRSTTYGKKRTYSDGRTWTQVLNDVRRAAPPVYEFINSFAQILIQPEPAHMLEWLPSMGMRVSVEELDPGDAPTAEVVNEGTSMNADWVLSLGIPPGLQGPKGDKGDPGSGATSVYRFSSIATIAATTGLTLDLSDDVGISVYLGTTPAPRVGFTDSLINCGCSIMGTDRVFPSLGTNEASTPAGVVGALSNLLSSTNGWADEVAKAWIPVFLDTPFYVYGTKTYSISGGVMYLSLGVAAGQSGPPDRIILKGTAVSPDYKDIQELSVEITTESTSPLTKWQVFVEEA